MRVSSSAPLGRILGQSAVQVSHTGDTTETTLASITIPANSMGANGRLIITARLSKTGTAGTYTPKIKFGGAVYSSVAIAATNIDYGVMIEIANRGSTNSQVGAPSNFAGGLMAGSGATAPTTSAIDTTADVALLITGTLASAADTVTLEDYQVLLYPKG